MRREVKIGIFMGGAFLIFAILVFAACGKPHENRAGSQQDGRRVPMWVKH